MRTKHLFVVTAVMYVPQAAVTLLAPAASLSMYGLPLGPGTLYMAQWAGLGSMVVGLLAWFARNLAPCPERRVVERTLLSYFLIAGLLALVGMLSDAMGPAGWALVAINALFIAAYRLVAARETQPGRAAAVG